jgi:hypothetical protein
VIRAMKFVAGLLMLPGVLLASTPPSHSSALSPADERQTIVTQPQVDRWLQIWQKRLALDAWKIDAHIVRQRDLNPDTLGNLKWNAASLTATIKVLDPRDYDMPAAQIPSDIERTVVHELIHLELSVLPRNGSPRVEEQVVNRVTEALLGLDHGDNYAARVAAGPVHPRIKRVAPDGDHAARSK